MSGYYRQYYLDRSDDDLDDSAGASFPVVFSSSHSSASLRGPDAASNIGVGAEVTAILAATRVGPITYASMMIDARLADRIRQRLRRAEQILTPVLRWPSARGRWSKAVVH